MSHFPDHDDRGMMVARRRGAAFHETVNQIANWLYELSSMSPRSRIEMRNNVELHAEHFDWSNLTRYYWEARAAAFRKYYGEVKHPRAAEESTGESSAPYMVDLSPRTRSRLRRQ
jgi:hypothetical protein